MYLKHLSLTNFRNFTRLDIDLPRRVVLLVGSNAQGKTSVLEAIYFLAAFTSFQTHTDRQLVNFIAARETAGRGAAGGGIRAREIQPPAGGPPDPGADRGQRAAPAQGDPAGWRQAAHQRGHRPFQRGASSSRRCRRSWRAGRKTAAATSTWRWRRSIPAYASVLERIPPGAHPAQCAAQDSSSERGGNSDQLEVWDQDTGRHGRADSSCGASRRCRRSSGWPRASTTS